MTRPICVLIGALGGEGGGVLAEWLYTAAVSAGHAAQATSVPGVAQRTGATTYYIEVAPGAQPAGAPLPVFSLSPVPGAVDLLVSSELLETLRQASAGFVSRERTWVISSTARALTVAEKMALADGRADNAVLAATLARHARGVDLLALDALAREANTAISAVLLGAIAACGVLPMPREDYEEAIRAAGKGVQASLAGFALAHDRLRARRAQQREAVSLIEALPGFTPPRAPLDAAALRPLARQRVASYQDERYAKLFDERLARLQRAEAASAALPESAADAAPPGATPITDEATRWLALWMCFDDLVHVARLKLAATRQARVRHEVNAAPGDVVKTFDHFKPGVPELAGLLPRAWATRCLAWDRRRVASGREPWALPMKLGTHGLRGTMVLRLVASCKPLRRHGQRFAEEQALIERWLSAVGQGAREFAPLGLELARCGTLIKGYGSTNERGKENLLHIVDHLAFAPSPAGARTAAVRAEAVRAARQAALADDAGRALDTTLIAHGAPARAPREQVVRWFKRRPETQRAG